MHYLKTIAIYILYLWLGLQISVYLIHFSALISTLDIVLWHLFTENNTETEKMGEKITGQNSDSNSLSPSHRLLLKETQLSFLITSLLCNKKIDSTFSSGDPPADLFLFLLSEADQRAYLSARQCINITVWTTEICHMNSSISMQFEFLLGEKLPEWWSLVVLLVRYLSQTGFGQDFIFHVVSPPIRAGYNFRMAGQYRGAPIKEQVKSHWCIPIAIVIVL